MKTIIKLMMTIPGGVFLIIFGIVILYLNHKYKKPSKNFYGYEILGDVNLKGYIVGVASILIGFYVVYTRVFITDFD